MPDQLAAEILASDNNGVRVGRGNSGAAVLLATDFHRLLTPELRYSKLVS
jgi:hypothetical protein